MSGARAVRKLRSETVTLLASSEASFLSNFSKFKSVVHASKTKTNLTAHQAAWRKEAMELRKQRKMAESEATAAIMNLTLDSSSSSTRKSDDPDSLSSSLRDIHDSRAALQRETQAMARELHAAVHRAKALLKAGKQQKVVEKAEQRIQPTTLKKQQHAPKKKSVGFTVGVSQEEMQADATKPTPVSASSTPLGSFLSNFLESSAITVQQLAAEENNLVAQLLLLQNTLEKYEAPIEIEPSQTADASPYIELASHEEMEQEDSPLEPLSTEPEEQQTAAASTTSLLEPLSGGEDSSRSPRPAAQQTFLTADALHTRSPRTRRTQRGLTQTLNGSGSTHNAAFPDVPQLEPSLSALPEEEVQKATAEREDQWSNTRLHYHRTLSTRYEENLSSLRDVFVGECAPLKARVEKSDQMCGWTAKQQARLTSIQQSYKTQGVKHAQLMDRLRLEFAQEIKQHSAPTAASILNSGSNISKDPLCLSDRLTLLEKSRTYRTQRLALLSAWEVERAGFMEKAREEMAEADRRYVAEYHRRREIQATLEAQSDLHDELAVLREEKQARDAAAAKEAAIKQAAEEEELRIKQAREQVVRSQQRILLQLYHAHLAAEEAELAQAGERARMEQLEEARAEREAAKPSVRRRQELLAERKQAQADREEQARRAEEAREARLEAMRQLVAPMVERDPTRMMQATAASAAEGDAHNPLFAVHGYDMSQLLKDKRFRLQLALWTAGVGNSSYAKQMVMSASPAQAPRPDMHSSVFPSRPT